MVPRPKPPAPPVQFATKLPPELHEAVAKIVPFWHAEMVTKLAEQGVHSAPHADRTAWLHTKIREDAARYGVAIASPASPPAAQPRARRKPKAGA